MFALQYWNATLVSSIEYLHCGKMYNNRVGSHTPPFPGDASRIQPAKKMLSHLFDLAEEEGCSSKDEAAATS